jgi:predicted transcriptional regulator of viral defense system
VELHERDRPLFALREVTEILGVKPGPARSFMAKLVSRGIASRLQPGLFVLVPFELGRERRYMGNPYVVARELTGGRDYYLSHSSAMDLHHMLTQPQLVVYVTCLRQMRAKEIQGTRYRFVHCRRRDMFGTMDSWIEKHEKVVVSDPERTILDGLRQPDYCGGIVEVAKGFRLRQQDLDPKRLVNYALRLGIGAVIRRLGFLMELWEMEAPEQIARLRQGLTETYVSLDPGLPPDGQFQRRWRLRLNVTAGELRAVVRT